MNSEQIFDVATGIIMVMVFCLLILYVATSIIMAMVVCLVFIRQRKRKEALEQFAWEMGLSYHEKDPGNIPADHDFLDFMHWGHDPNARNVLEGNYRGHDILFFNHCFTFKGHSSKGRNSYPCPPVALVKLPKDYLDLVITPRFYAEWTRRWFGERQVAGEVDIGDQKFSKKYSVRSVIDDYARDFLQPEVKKLFLENQQLYLELKKNTLVLVFYRCWNLKVQQVRKRLDMAIDLLPYLPEVSSRTEDKP